MHCIMHKQKTNKVINRNLIGSNFFRNNLIFRILPRNASACYLELRIEHVLINMCFKIINCELTYTEI